MTRTRTLCAASWLAAWIGFAPAPAEARVRALFVGIDTYEYSGADNGFENLHGAVNDVATIKSALERVYGWGITADPAASCPAAPVAGMVSIAAPTAATVSITLVDACATRANIMAALHGLIAVSAPSDTVIFYYAGHGSQISDSTFFTKASTFDDTLLTYDARGPADANFHTEIIDRELNVIIANANAVQGANVITIFDSCHSATAARAALGGGVHGRDAAARVVPAIAQKPDVIMPQTAQVLGQRAHLAAAGDTELASEAPDAGGTPHGVFTTALSAAIVKMPNAALADLLDEARRLVILAGFGATQHPTGDGLLIAFDTNASAGLLVAATAVPGTTRVTLQAGALGDISPQSRFALFPDWTSARKATAPPLATGAVATVADTRADLALIAPPASALPPNLVARETDHVFNGDTVGVALAIADFKMAAQVRAALAGIAFVQVGQAPQIVIASSAQGLVVRTLAGLVLAALPPVTDPAFAQKVRDALAPIARINALLALKNARGLAEITLCIDDRWYRRQPATPFPCPVDTGNNALAPAPHTLARDTVAYLTVINTARAPRYIYVFAIGDDTSVTLLTVQDAPLPPGRPQSIDIEPHYIGQTHFLVLATPQPIDGAALEQNGGARDAAGCTSPLDRLLCESNGGSRNPATSHVGDWGGLVRTIDVVDTPPVVPATGGR